MWLTDTRDLTTDVELLAAWRRGTAGRSMESRVAKGDEGGQGHEQAAKRRAAFCAMGSQAARSDAAPPPEVTCDKG